MQHRHCGFGLQLQLTHLDECGGKVGHIIGNLTLAACRQFKSPEPAFALEENLFAGGRD